MWFSAIVLQYRLSILLQNFITPIVVYFYYKACSTYDFETFSQVEIPPESSLITIPDEIYREACVYTTEEAIASCQVIGCPAMIKASWGGGGKGIRKVCFWCSQYCSIRKIL